MNTPICPTCGCSLVRLGIGNDTAITHEHDGSERRFCCQACVELFVGDPEKFLNETCDLIVCPTCLAEKPRERSFGVQINGEDVRFCRCPYCPEEFQRDPQYYIDRYDGKIPVESVLNHC